jgi:hypothetical protein
LIGTDLDTLNLDEIMGMVLNIERPGWLCMRDSRHWIALAKVDNKFYDLDSNHETPQPFNTSDDVCQTRNGIGRWVV